MSIYFQVAAVKKAYAQSLKELEAISLEIHRKRGDLPEEEEEEPTPGVREPGVGAEQAALVTEHPYLSYPPYPPVQPTVQASKFAKISPTADTALHKILPNLNQTVDKLKSHPSGSGYSELDYELELDRCDLQSLGSMSAATSSAVSDDDCIEDDSETEELKAMATKQPTLQVPSHSGTPRKPETFDSVRKLSENLERQMGETISRLGTILTLRTKNPEICYETKEKY